MNRVFYFNITYRCNNNCLFCAADHGLNDTGEEICFEAFRSIIEKYKVDKGDVIVLNGGEPTIHSKFLEILDYCKKTGAFIDLFTNGKRLADKKICAEVANYQHMIIRIPIFGSCSVIHDKLTGANGNFLSLMKTLDNLMGLKREGGHFNLDIKLLLSKATTIENYKIAQLILDRYKEYCLYGLSLNMLIISKYVEKNAEVMIEPYTLSVNESIDIIDLIQQRGGNVSYSSIPICLLPIRLRRNLNLACSESEHYYFDPFCLEGQLISNLTDNHICKDCIYKNSCVGFSEVYLKHFGNDEFKAIKEA